MPFKLATIHSLAARRQEFDTFAKSLRRPFWYHWVTGTTLQFIVELCKNTVKRILFRR